MATRFGGNYVPHKRPRHCPEGHCRCSMCNKLVRVGESVPDGPMLCNRCLKLVMAPSIEIAPIVLPKIEYGRTPRPVDDMSRWPELADKPPKKKRKPRRTRAVIRIEDGRRFSSVKQAAEVTSGGSKSATVLYSHLNGYPKTFCGCTFKYERDEGKK